MGRIPRPETKKNIVFQAFILFTQKPYDKVTFDDLERVTGLSRGALLYHFKTKLDIFNAVIENSLLNRSSVLNIPIKDKDCLKNFILDFIANSAIAIKTMANLGIKNVNMAYFNIESQAHYFYPNYNKISKQQIVTDTKVWLNVINKALDNKEIEIPIEPETLALLFEKTYLGHAYAAVSEDKGCDVDLLKKELLSLYELVKKKQKK